MQPLDQLIQHFKALPSIGAKSAQRLAFYILSQPESWVQSFADTLKHVKEKVSNCSQCFNITLSDPCEICQDTTRDQKQICVVADPKDLIAIEKTKCFKGIYHILGGVISPIDGVNPDVLKITELVHRVEKNNFDEIFFAINPTVEGEATMIYITALLKDFGVRMTRIAYGLPIGADIDYMDELTISKALEGRVEINF